MATITPDPNFMPSHRVSLEPTAGAALDPLVEELTFVAFRLTAADPGAIITRGDIIAAAGAFSQILENGWVPGRSVAVIDLAGVGDRMTGTDFEAHLLLGVAGSAGSTGREAADFGDLARRALARHPSPYAVEAVDPAPVLGATPAHTALICQRTASVVSDGREASTVSRWDRDGNSWLDVAEALLARPGTRVRATFLATELGVDDSAWLRAQLGEAHHIVTEPLDADHVDQDLQHRARRVELTLLDMLESFRTPLYCGEVAVLSDDEPTEFFLREIAGAITCEFDVLRRGETPTVAARQRWVGGYEVERNPAGHQRSLAVGLPLRGGCGPRRITDLFSLTEAACAFQWPVPAGRPVPTVATDAGRGLPAPRGVATSGALIGVDPTGRQIRLGLDDRSVHVHVLGVTGCGKSTLLDHFVADDVASARPFFLLDRHGAEASRAVRRLRSAGREFVVFDPADHTTSRLALFPGASVGSFDAAQVGRSVSRLVEAVTSHLPADWAGPRFRDVARMVLTLLAYADEPLPSVGRALYSADFTSELIEAAADLGREVPADLRSQIANFHSGSNADRSSVAAWVASKFDELANSTTLPNLLGSSNEATDVADLVRRSIPIVVNLGAVDDLEARLMGHLLLGVVLDEAFARPEDQRGFWPVYVDEAEKFYAPNIERALNEGRKYGISLTLAHQHLSQLPGRVRDAVLGSCNLQVLFRLTDHDAHELASAAGQRSRDLVGQPNLHATVRRSGQGAGQLSFTCKLQPYADLEPLPEVDLAHSSS